MKVGKPSNTEYQGQKISSDVIQSTELMSSVLSLKFVCQTKVSCLILQVNNVLIVLKKVSEKEICI